MVLEMKIIGSEILNPLQFKNRIDRIERIEIAIIY